MVSDYERDRIARWSVLEYGGHEHDERNVEGEAIAAFRAVYREDLVGI